MGMSMELARKELPKACEQDLCVRVCTCAYMYVSHGI